jgi:hypothetical protein
MCRACLRQMGWRPPAHALRTAGRPSLWRLSPVRGVEEELGLPETAREGIADDAASDRVGRHPSPVSTLANGRHAR